MCRPSTKLADHTPDSAAGCATSPLLRPPLRSLGRRTRSASEAGGYTRGRPFPRQTTPRTRRRSPGNLLRAAARLHHSCTHTIRCERMCEVHTHLRELCMCHRNPSMGRRRPASEALAARRGAGKSSRKPLKTGHRVRKVTPASVGSTVVSAAARCAVPGPTRREANHAAPASLPTLSASSAPPPFRGSAA